VVTPIPSRTPEFDWSGRKLTIAFQSPLLENRTYAITVGAGLSDLGAPGNRLGRPFTLRFSTGDVIDSGVVRGRVLGVERRRAFVFAYRLQPGAPDTLNPDHTRPDFIAPVADDGSFALEALPPATLRLLAVTDEFGDQLYSPGADAFGIASSDVTVDNAYTPVDGVAIRLSPAPVDLVGPALYSARSLAHTRTELRFNEPIDTTSVRADKITIESNGVATTIRDAWRSTTNWLAIIVAHDPVTGSEAVARVRDLRDTAGNVIADSAATASFTIDGARDTIAPVLTIVSVDSVRAYSYPDSIAIGFDEAVVVTNPDGAVALLDTTGRTMRFGLRRVSPAYFLAWPKDTMAGAARGTLEINLARVADLDGNRRDSVVRIRVPIGAIRQTGTISGTLTDSSSPSASHVITAQLTGTSRTFTRIVRSGAWEMADVPEGEYRITAFRDDNANGRYDFGSITPYKGPEVLVEWNAPVRVRPRWATTKVELAF
ncbi:MAG: Ig-like domain-containing protein, partial [bacterium]|nr:Ig-like domain-containing protein [Candidatus Kapabacteria bacterium]